MRSLHWLVLIPVYFFGALSLFALFDASARLARADVSSERLATLAVATSILGLTGLFLSGLVTIGDVTLLPVLGLALASFALAGLAALCARAFPVPSDASGERRRESEPQVF